MEINKSVSHQQACQLLHNKFVVVLGDSIQRSVYKDVVLLLQKDKCLSRAQLKTKGERSFEQDHLVEGGSLGQMHNGTGYREVRQFQTDHHLVRFYFVTRIYSSYMQSILKDFQYGLKPDVIILNSCIWDISRYGTNSFDNYRENLRMFFDELRGIMPQETLVVWNLTMPLGKRVKGGFLVPEIEHRASQLRYDVIEANFYSGTLADAYGMDVLDFHFQFRFSLQHRVKDGVHWNAAAHRKITSLILEHCAQAWGVIMPSPATDVEHTGVTAQHMVTGNAYKAAKRHPSKVYYDSEEFHNDNLPADFMDFTRNPKKPDRHGPSPATFRYERHPSKVYDEGYSEDFYSYYLPHHALDFTRNSMKPLRQDPSQATFRYGHYSMPPPSMHQQKMRSQRVRHHYAPYNNH